MELGSTRPPSRSDSNDGRVVFVGAFAYAREVLSVLSPVAVVTARSGPGLQRLDTDAPVLYDIRDPLIRRLRPDLIVVAGWRRLIPGDVLDIPRFGVVGFHSAKLPEYPGRAPVPWALIRGDVETANTMLYLDTGIDTGDIIDSRTIPIGSTDTVHSLYQRMAETSVEMLSEHLPALLRGTAPRIPQDPLRRGPLTPAETPVDLWTS